MTSSPKNIFPTIIYYRRFFLSSGVALPTGYLVAKEKSVSRETLFILICFSGFKLKKSVRAVRIFSPTALAVFVIHVHTITWNHLFYALPSKMNLWKTVSVPRLCANIVGWALLTFVVCVLLDLIRIGLFSLLRIPKTLKAADGVLEKLLQRIRRR